MILYKQDNNQRIRVWNIESYPGGMIIKHGQLNGALIEKLVPVKTNQSGRSFEEQVDLEMNRRIMNQMDQGYVMDLNEARLGAVTNTLDLPLPMLAQPIKNMKASADMYYMQYKYDGMRCMIHKGPDGLTAYSRKGKRIETINHILEQIHLPDEAIIDGELYMHGAPLQTIMSLAKRYQPATRELMFVAYDIVSPTSYNKRTSMVHDYASRSGLQIISAPTKIVTDATKLSDYMTEAKALGYEGLILRDPYVGYEAGKRSQSLIKVKTVEDDEFLVEDIKESKDGHAILCCGNFSVIAPGTHEYKRYIYQHPHEFIGRHVRVEYANKTKDGVPFHPVATNFSE